MYEIITQAKFRELMSNYIQKSSDTALFGIDVIYPLLEKLRFEEAQPLMSGYSGLINTLDVLSSNIDLIIKDRLTKDNGDVVYYLNEHGMPAKISKEEFDKMNKVMNAVLKDDDYETSYLQSPTDKDEKMFG